MNGRLYDGKLHRFLQPDNFIQDITNTQNYNRYGYVLNNPFKYTDPSGEEFISLGLAIGISAAISALTHTITALVADVPFSAGGFAKSVIFGAASGAISFGIGEAFTNVCQFGLKLTYSAIAHGASQGVMTGIQGGNFWSSFASGVASSVVSSAFGGGYINKTDSNWGGIGGALGKTDIGVLAFGTVSGGAGAALTGGNFWQGAATGLVVSGLNHAMHKVTLNSRVNKELEFMGYSKDCIPDFSLEQVEEMVKLSPELSRLNKLMGNKAKFELSEVITSSFGEVKPGTNVATLYRKAFGSAKSLFITVGHEMNHLLHINLNLVSKWKPNHSYRKNHSEALAYWWEMNWDPNSINAAKQFNKHNKLAPITNAEKTRGY